MYFLNHREGGVVFYRYFSLGCVSLKIQKSQGKAVEVTVNSKEEKSSDFCLNFVQEFGPRMKVNDKKSGSLHAKTSSTHYQKSLGHSLYQRYTWRCRRLNYQNIVQLLLDILPRQRKKSSCPSQLMVNSFLQVERKKKKVTLGDYLRHPDIRWRFASIVFTVYKKSSGQ